MAGNYPGGGSGDAGIEGIIRVIVFFAVVAVVVGVLKFPGGCKQDPFGPKWNQQPDRDQWNARDPWAPDPKVLAEQRRREEADRRERAEAATKLNQILDEKLRQIRTFETEDKYRDTVALASALGRQHASEAERLGLAPQLRNVQQAAVRSAVKLAKTRAVRLVGQERYAEAAEAIEELVTDMRHEANEVGLAKELDDLHQAYQFVKELAKSAEKGSTK